MADQPTAEDQGGFVTELRVRFRDLDARGHVNNAVYLTYFETARMMMWAEMTGSIALQGREMIVAEITCTYKSPALFNEILEIRVSPVAIRRSSFILRYRIVGQQSQRLIVTGRSVQVAFDYAENCTVPVWPELRAGLERMAGRELGPDEG